MTPITRKTLRQVRLHRLLADRELARDQLVRQAPRYEAQDILLALGEPVERSCGAARVRSACRRAGVERRLAPRGGAQGLRDLLRLRVLQKVADLRRRRGPAGSGRDPRRTSARRPRTSGWVAAICPRRLDAVEHRHLEVHQHDVGLGLERSARPPPRPFAAAPTSSTSSNVVTSSCSSPVRTTAWSSAISEPDHACGTFEQEGRALLRASSVHRAGPSVRAASSSSSDRPTWPSSRRRSRSSGAKPAPSSVTSSRTPASSALHGDRDPVRGGMPLRRFAAPPRRPGRRVRSASSSRASAAADRRARSSRHVLATVRARSASAASSPLARRFGGWISTRS